MCYSRRVPRLTSIRFPDELAAAIETSRGRESFHAHVLVLCELALRAAAPLPHPTPRKPVAKTKPAVAVTAGSRAFRSDFKKLKAK